MCLWSCRKFADTIGHKRLVGISQNSQANSAFHTSGVGKWVPASAGKAKAGMVHSVSACMWGVQAKPWDPLRTYAIPERLRGVIMTRRYTNTRLPLPYLTASVQLWTKVNWLDFEVKRSEVKLTGRQNMVKNLPVQKCTFPVRTYWSVVCYRRPLSLF